MAADLTQDLGHARPAQTASSVQSRVTGTAAVLEAYVPQVTHIAELRRRADGDNNNENNNNGGDNNNNNNNNNNANDNEKDNKDNKDTTKSDANSSQAPASSKQESQAKSSEAQPKSSATPQSSEQASSSEDPKSSSTEQPSSAASITSSITKPSMPALSDMPTLSSSTQSYKSTSTLPDPTITVPSMSNNPYMGTSSVPEGTVFIAFGAVLGGIILALLVWRAMAARALRKSLVRFEDEDSAGPLMGAMGGKSSSTLQNSMSEIKNASGHLSSHFGSDKMTQNNMSSDTLPTQSLYFSPTTEVMNSANNPFLASRSSTYLPAGFYATAPGSFTSRSSRHLSTAHDSVYSGIGAGGQSNSRQSFANRSSSAYLDQFSLAEDTMHRQDPERQEQSPDHSMYSDNQRSQMQGGVPTSGRMGVQQQSYNSPRAPSAYLDDLLAHED